MSLLPGIVSTRKPKKLALDGAQLSSLKYGDPIVIKAGQVDTGNTAVGGRTTILRPGNVLIKETGTSQFVVANAFALADQGAVAAITSAQTVDAGWQTMTLELFRNGVKVAQVVSGALDDTAGEWVTLINADADFSAHVVASGTTTLILTDILGGGDALRVEASINDAYGTVFNTTQSYAEAKGTTPDVRVLLEEVDMLDASGTAGTGFSSENVYSGKFRTADLVTGGTLGSVSASAQAILESRGSEFVA